MTHIPADPSGHLDIERLEEELDNWYLELLQVQGSEPDVALVRIAGLQAKASATRARVIRLESRAARSFLSRELDPFLATLTSHALLHQRVASIRRGGSR
jgi:hypothetical protein